MMALYVGTKLVKAEPMSKYSYCMLRGWLVPAGEDPDEVGYLVEYMDGGKPNVVGYEGYISWSPKPQFDGAYRGIEALPFSLALEMLLRGASIARSGWNGKGMFAYLVPANAYPASTVVAREHFGDQLVPYNAYMALKGADGRVSTWAPSGSDCLADDWIIVTGPNLYAMSKR